MANAMSYIHRDSRYQVTLLCYGCHKCFTAVPIAPEPA